MKSFTVSENSGYTSVFSKASLVRRAGAGEGPVQSDGAAQIVDRQPQLLDAEPGEEEVKGAAEEVEAIADARGLTEAPKPGRSSATTRLARAIGGMMSRQRNEEVGQPWRRSTAGPSPSSR